MCTKKTSKKTQRKMEKIESDLRLDWLNYELDFVELALEARELVQETKKSEKNGSDFENWREYLRVKCLMNEKVQNAEQDFLSIGAILIAGISVFISVLSLIFSQNQNLSNELKITLIILSAVLLLAIGLMAYPIMKKFVAKYPQERAFYELLLHYADEISQPVVTENVSVESSTNNSKYIFRIGQLIKRK